jgi:hypothetical protein
MPCWLARTVDAEFQNLSRCAEFLAFGVLAPVDAPFQRYADEFIHRMYGMTLRSVAILAAGAFAWGWRRNATWRV